MQLLLSRGANAAIHLTAFAGDLEKTKSMLESGVNVNLRDVRGYTALHYAAEAGHEPVAEMLIANGAHVNFDESEDSGSTNESPLHLAAYAGNTDVVRLLLTNGAYIGTQDNGHWTPLHMAAYRGHKDVVELLLAHGAPIDAQDYEECTPLYDAAHAGHRDVVQLLLAKGADIKAGRVGNELGQFDSGSQSQEKLVEQAIAACKPYSIIVSNPKSVREYLRYNQMDFDELWIPDKADLEGIDPALGSRLQKNIVVGAMEHFDPAAVLARLHLYNREYSGITREGRRYIICQMIIHDLPESRPDNEFQMIHGSANGVVRFVFDLESKAIAEIDCEFPY